jgi:hypothetical protein
LALKFLAQQLPAQSVVDWALPQLAAMLKQAFLAGQYLAA